MIADLKAGISGKDNHALFMEVFRVFFAGKQPEISRYDNNDHAWTDASPQDILSLYKTEVFIEWNGYGYLGMLQNRIVLFGLDKYDIDPKKILGILEELPFEVASFATLYPEWLNPVMPYEAPSFGNGHMQHGWACAFKGDGFNKLVSRRWLDFGPWKQHNGKNDTQLVQFHQLGLASQQALSQCREGHHLMGISDDGGFIQDDYVYKYRNEGLYDAKDRMIRIVVHGTPIPNRQLLDACAAKHNHVLGNDMPVNNVAYVFMQEGEAQQRLHAIWLRGLECRTIRGGKEITLTDEYHPSPEKPSWTKE